ncbi:MAG: ROK family protein, partial [Bacilli bacterium]
MKKYTPKLDPGFRPIGVELDDYVSRAKKAGKHEITICVERNDGYNYIYKVPAFKDNTGHDEETILLLERVVKTLLWLSGGYKVIINGSKVLAEELAKQYSYGGKRDFDTHFMERVYEQKFEVRYERCKRKLVEHKEVIEVQGDLSGHRIGFDAGGSDRKVSAVIDGKTVFATETVWNPKTNSNPQYHYDGIVDSFNQAKKHLNGRVDAVGISSAGIYINKKAM